MRIGVSLALSVLLAQAVYADGVCSSTLSGESDLKIGQNQTCVISSSKEEVKSIITNDGILEFDSSGAKITFKDVNTAKITSENRGKILVTRSATFDASAGGENVFLIEGQDISISESRTLTLKATKIAFGGSKSINIIGESDKVSNSSSLGITLDTTTELNTKNAEFRNIRISGTSLNMFKNTQTTLENTYIISTRSDGLTLQKGEDTSVFHLIGESNTISADTNALNIQGEHSFSGNGFLNFVGGTITLGNSATTALVLASDNTTSGDKKEIPTLGFIGDTKVVFKNLTSSDLTLEIVKSGNNGAMLHNIQSIFTNGTLQALDRDGKDQILVIENGNETNSLTAAGNIAINAGNTIFKGSGIEIYGQEITLNNTGETTLALSTINDGGEIVLGKANTTITSATRQDATQTNKDGEVTIKGQSDGSSKQALQLRALTTTFGGKVTLENLTISTQAKNEQENEGMIFSLDDSSILTLNGVTLTSGIDQNYQDLSFTTLEGTSTLSLSNSASSSIKASSLAFNNQHIDLSSVGSGKSLDLYSYGNVVLTSETGEGLGHFAFTNTLITNGSSAGLHFYSNQGAKILASNLTLKNLTLTSYQINGSASVKNGIDLSEAGSNLIIQESVTIDTKRFMYGDTQGIGMDIAIQGGESKNGKLTLKSEDSGSMFTFGGTLTIDNSSVTNGQSSIDTSQIEVVLGTTQNNIQEQANNTVDWCINGGLTAIGNANPTSSISTSSTATTTTLKAKSFIFGEGSIVSSINGTLSLSASADDGSIDLSKALTLLQGISTAEATISKVTGTLTIGNVLAKGKTKIESATFSDSNITIRSIDSTANTLTISGSVTISGIQSIDIADASLEIKNSTYNAEFKLNAGGSIISNGDSAITASKITAGDGNNSAYSINVESGTLTLKEVTSAGDGIGSLVLGAEGKQGGNLVLTNNDSTTYHTFKAPNIASYKDSSITAKTFAFADDKDLKISSTGGELKLIAKDQSNTETLTLKQGEIKLDNGTLSYYKYDTSSSKDILGKMKLYNDAVPNTSVIITSQGTSAIKAEELELKGNTITSSGGVLTLYGLKQDSTIGTMTINNAGGVTVTKQDNHDDLAEVKLSSTLTLTANAPYVSSSSPLGGGKFGVLQAQSVNFAQNGGASSPLVYIKVLDKPLEGEELFTLQEGGQVVVWTTNGITKGNGSSTPIALDDISIDNGGYKSLFLDAKLIYDSTTSTQVNAIKVLLSVSQNNASELVESISDTTAKAQMQTLFSEGNHQEIIDSIFGSSTNPLKVGFAENIAQGNVVVVGNALNYIDDTFKSVAESIHLNDRVQTQIYLSQTSLIESRMARHNNPHQNKSELLSFIRSYHNTYYASSDDDLLASPESEEQTAYEKKGSLWVSYDGGLATGNSNNSLINGISAGYDHAINSSYLVGGLISYAYGALDSSYLHNTSHNIGFGLYSRMYFGSNEVDLTLSQNIGLVSSEINVGNTTMPSLLNGSMQYNLYRTNALARYGYTFKVGEEESPYYLKPLVGIGMSYTYQESSESDAVASITMNKANLFKLEMNVGMEMRKYINEGTYFFVMPLLERELYGNSCDINVGFVDSANLSYTLDYQSQTSVALYAGGEGNLTENLALSGSVGVKVGIEKSEVLTNWSVGLKYKF